MSAKDRYHDQVKDALIKEKWTITHDPYTVTFGQRNVYVDLGAERILAAEKDDQKIAVEIKTFLGTSDIRNLEAAVGQYVFYRALLTRYDPARRLYLAVPHSIFISILEEPIARPVLEDEEIAIFTFDPEEEKIIKWTN